VYQDLGQVKFLSVIGIFWLVLNLVHLPW